jgi:hypothetical protein
MKKFMMIKTLPSILDEFWTLCLKVFLSICSIYFLIRIVFAFWSDVNSTYENEVRKQVIEKARCQEDYVKNQCW